MSLSATNNMAHIIYAFKIPDPERPLPGPHGLGSTCELIPFVPKPIRAEDVIGRRVDEVKTIVGTYGMGGPGFFGLRLGSEWLVLSLWGASEWIHVDNRLVTDSYGPMAGRPLPWIHDIDELTPRLVGTDIASFQVARHSLRITFSNGAVLEVEESADRRPILQGSKQPRAFSPEDDLTRAVFLAPTAKLWV